MVFDGLKLKDYRKVHGIKQEELANQSGVSINVIKNIESNRRKTKVEDMTSICNTLGVDIDLFTKKDTKVITCLIHKGGSTKTTTICNLAYSLATEYGKKVLVIDSDLQKNLTVHFGMDIDEDKNFYKAFTRSESIKNHIRPTEYENIDIVTSTDAMAIMEEEISKMEFREYRMRNILEEIIAEDIYSFILIDCNPVLGYLNRSILYATDHLLIPLEASEFGVSGLVYFDKYIQGVMRYHPKLNILGVIFSKYDKRKTITHNIVGFVTEAFHSFVFNTKIPVDTAVEQAQYNHMPVGAYFDKSKANQAYKELAVEFMELVDEKRYEKE